MSIPIKTLTLPISSGGSTTETEYSFITPEDMDQKANVDGYYENLVSGGTDQIISSVFEEDSEPYLFRTSGGSIDIGDREENTIVGGTVAWNQLVSFTENVSTEKDVVWKRHTDGSIEFNGTASSSGGIAGFPVANGQNHIYYIAGNPQNDPNGMYLSSQSYGVDLRNKGTLIKNLSANKTWYYTFAVTSGVTYDNVVFKPQCFDLTQMFGSTIADYIYSLEQANAGAGVAWFKKLFPKPYYAYDAGTLKSVEGLLSHDMRGFNAWDEEWEMGDISSSNGANYSSTAYWRTKNYIKILPNTIYRVTAEGLSSSYAIRQRFYDADKNFLGVTTGGGSQYVTTGSTFRTPVNACYMRFAPDASNVPAGTKMCINLSWDGERDGEYEPYVKHSYPLDDSLTLRGIPKLDSNNKLYYDGDVYEADGTVTRKYGIVDLGTLTPIITNWRANDDGVGWLYSKSSIPSPNINHADTGNAICTKFIMKRYHDIYAQNVGMSFYNSNDYGLAIWQNDKTLTSVNAIKTAMSGVYLVYELATPTIEEAEPFVSPQIVNDFGTEEYVTDSIVPVGHVTKYMPNLKAKLEMAPDSPSDNGDYVVRHANGKNEYVPLVIPTELPTAPSEDGTYHLKLTVANGTATLAWEAE